MTHEQSILVALCRCVLAGNPNEATSHQIMRLYKMYIKQDNKEMSDRVHELLNPTPNEMDGFKIVQS